MVDLPIREFAYLDRERLEDFLSALIGGLPIESKEGSARDDAQVDTGVDVGAASVRRLGGRSHLTWEELRKATPASLFEELIEQLRARSAIQLLDAFDVAIWQGLEAGEFIDASIGVAPSALENLFDLIRRLKGFIDLFGSSETDTQTMSQVMQYLTLLGNDKDAMNVRLIPAGGPGPRCVFVASLNDDHIRANKSALAGEFRVFGRIQRKLSKGERFELFSLMPGLQLSATQLREFITKLGDLPPQLGRAPTVNDLQVSHPAIVLTPVALYR